MIQPRLQPDSRLVNAEMTAETNAEATAELRERFRQEVWAIAHHVQTSAAAAPSAPSAPSAPASPTADGAVVQPLASLSKLVFRERECLRNLTLTHPLVVILLQGQKTLHLSGEVVNFSPGDVFLMPSHWLMDVINQPMDGPACQAEQPYVALVLELSDGLLERVRQAYPELAEGAGPGADAACQPSELKFQIPLSQAWVESLLHLVKGMGAQANPRLDEHRLMEVVLMLLQSEVRSHLLQALYPDWLTHLRYLIRGDLAADWSLERLAQAAHMSVSTLKRRLQDSELSFRQLLDQERMGQAMALLQRGEQTVAQVALSCGYLSQSRFAVRFRKFYGVNPSEVDKF